MPDVANLLIPLGFSGWPNLLSGPESEIYFHSDTYRDRLAILKCRLKAQLLEGGDGLFVQIVL